MISTLRLLAAVIILCFSSINGYSFNIQEVTSPGGIKAWLVEEKAVPLIAMNFSFRSGSTRDPVDRQGLSEFLTGMLDEGAGDLTSKEFQQRRDGLAFRMSFSSGRDLFQGSFQTLSRNREASFELLRVAITKPRFDAEPLERVRQQFLLSVREKKENPQDQAFTTWIELALPGDVYRRDDSGTEQSMSSITANDLRSVHERVFDRNTLQVAVVGDIDATELGPLLDEVFGDLPAKTMPTELPPANITKGAALKVITREMPQSVIIFGHEGLKRNDPDFIPAYIMSEILGGGGFNSRLTDEIREKRGLTYGVGFGLSPLERVGLYVGSLQTSNQKAGEALALVRQVIAQMAEQGPTQLELDEAKTFLTGSYALRFSSNTEIADQLLGIQQQGLPIDYVERRNSMIEAVTLNDVKLQARRLLHPDRLIVSVVGKPEGIN